MNGRHAITEEELHAFIDGELDDRRAAEIASLVAADAALASQIEAFRDDKKQIAHLHESLRDRPVPQEWVRRIESGTTRPRATFSAMRFSRRAVTAVAAALLLMLGLRLAYDDFIRPQGDSIVAEALAARREAIRPEQSLPAASLASSETPNQVLTTALAMMLKAPDLTKLGYRLADVRVYSDVPGGKAVELGYRNADNRLFTLYLRHPSGPARVDLMEQDGMRLCIWQDDVLGTVMLGEMSAGEMARMASLAYSGLSL